MIRIQKEDFVLEEIVDEVRRKRAGGIVLFVGTVRQERALRGLEYEVYEEMARAKLEGIRKEAIGRFGITALSIAHRTGKLKIGENVVAVAASAPHRHEAFRAAEWAMREVKRVVPIWKKDVKAHGRARGHQRQARR